MSDRLAETIAVDAALKLGEHLRDLLEVREVPLLARPSSVEILEILSAEGIEVIAQSLPTIHDPVGEEDVLGVVQDRSASQEVLMRNHIRQATHGASALPLVIAHAVRLIKDHDLRSPVGKSFHELRVLRDLVVRNDDTVLSQAPLGVLHELAEHFQLLFRASLKNKDVVSVDL